MFKKILESSTHKTRLILFLYSIFIIFTFIFLDKLFFKDNVKSIIIDRGYDQILQKEKSLQKFLSKSELILKSLRDTENFKSYLNNKKEDTLNQVKKQFSLISKSNINISQLRFINKSGDEIIRFDREKEFEEIYEQKILQNKANRYYFKDSKNKPLEKVWFSNLDLNIENGKVQKPNVPTLRAILPIEKNNEFSGIIIVNYFMNDFLKEFKNVTLYNMILTDKNGNTLIHYDDKKSWGLFKEKNYNIKSDYKEYKSILNNDSFKNDNIISKKLDIQIANKPILILKTNKINIEEEIQSYSKQYLITTLIVLILTFIASYFLQLLLTDILKDLKSTKKLNKKLKTLYERFFAIVNTTKDSILLLNNDMNIEFSNTAFFDTLKYSESEVLNKNISLFIKKDIEKFRSNFDKVFQDENSITFECNSKTKEKEKLILLISLLKIKSQKSILLVARDITELKNKERQLLEKEQILLQQSKIAAMGEMLENIAHQWRQPLSVISTSASGMKVQKEFNILDDKLMEEELTNIIMSTEYLSNTIEDFRDFFNNEKTLESFEVSEVVDRTLYLMTSKFTSSDIHFVINKKDVCRVEGIKNEFIQCLINIFSNAQYELDLKQKNESKLIQINIYKDLKYYIIEINDNGRGIDKSIISKVFDSYFTTKNQDGTGIGLYMTKKIIQEHFHGKIEVSNKEFSFKNETYTGACFKISLPV